MIHRSDSDAITTIRLDRPPANALELDSTESLRSALEAAAVDRGVRGVVLTGTGEFFSAGLDLKIVPHYDAAAQGRMVMALSRLVRVVYGFPKPLVTALNGHAVAAGTLLALASDYRVGPDDQSRFGLTGVRVGIPYPAAAMAVIEAELHPPARRVVLLTARTFEVHEALRMGVVDEITPRDRVVERAQTLVKDLIDMPEAGYRTTKLALRRSALETIDRVLEQRDDPFLDAWIPSSGRGSPGRDGLE